MGQVLRGSARTTATVRRAIQHSQESLKVLSGRDAMNRHHGGEVEKAHAGH
jgi:hypothetical protein